MSKIRNQKLSEAKLDYRLNFFGSGQLGNDKDTQQKLKLGTIDIALLFNTRYEYSSNGDF